MRLNKTIILVCCLCCIMVIGACKSDNIVNESVSNNNDKINGNQSCSVLSFDSIESFKKEIEKDVHNEKTDFPLRRLDHFYDFSQLPQNAVFNALEVTQNCNAIDVSYVVDNDLVDVFWFRAIDGDEYDFVSDTANIFRDFEMSTLDCKGCKVLEIYHPKSFVCPEAYFQFTFVNEFNDNMEVSVPETLILRYGRECFLDICRICLTK